MRAVAFQTGALLLVALLPSCVLQWEMERSGPPGTPCPATSEPPALTAPPDTMELRWYRPAAPGDHERGAEWCRTLGPPVFRPLPSADLPELRVGDSLTVVTWSMRYGGGDLEALLSSELGLRCNGTASALDTGYPSFVMMLQATFRRSEELPRIGSTGRSVPRAENPTGRGAELPDVVEVSDRCGLALHYVPSARNGPDTGPRPREDRGNAILSTLPLRMPLAIELPHSGERAVAVGATVDFPGGERVRMVSAHVDGLSTLARTLLTGNQTRSRQVAGLIDGIEEADDDGPLIAATLVGGDFAVWDGDETALRRMRDAFPHSPAWDRLNTRGRFPADHIFFRRGSFLTITLGSYARLRDAYGSSHYGRRAVMNYLPARR